MATVISENKIVMGQPMYRFEIETENGKEYFDQGWKQAVRAYQAYKAVYSILVCREWDKGSGEWVNTTEETIDEGRGRAERLRARAGKEPDSREVVPALSDDSIVTINNASLTLKMVAQAGKKALPTDEDKRQIGMELMEVFTALGYEIKDIKNLVTQYNHSVNAQPLPPELVK